MVLNDLAEGLYKASIILKQLADNDKTELHDFAAEKMRITTMSKPVD